MSPLKKVREQQTVATEPVQNVPTQPPECLQNVSTQWKQNGATHNRENNRENKETEKTDQSRVRRDQKENQATWEKAVEQVKSNLPLGETADRLAGTTLIAVTDTAALIFVPNRTAGAWLERRLYRQIANAIKGVVGKDVDLQFITAS